jgi:uncharacterized membrane protein YtjA (UPF0391 family)
MKKWAIAFLAIGLIAGLVAFAGIGMGAWTFALIAVFFVLAMDGVTLLVTRTRRVEHPRMIERPM